MNPVMPQLAEVVVNVLLALNTVLALTAVWLVLRERKPLPWTAFEVLGIVLVPLVGPGVVLWLRRRQLLARSRRS